MKFLFDVTKFETKEIVYFVKNGKVIFAQHKITGKFVKHYVAQMMHDKMLSAAKAFKKFMGINKFQENIWKMQLKTYFKSFGYKVSCCGVDNNNSALTLNTFLKLAV